LPQKRTRKNRAIYDNVLDADHGQESFKLGNCRLGGCVPRTRSIDRKYPVFSKGCGGAQIRHIKGDGKTQKRTTLKMGRLCNKSSNANSGKPLLTKK